MSKAKIATFEVRKDGSSQIAETGSRTRVRWKDVRRIVFAPSAPTGLALVQRGGMMPSMSVPLAVEAWTTS
jgi:hypothetical protein